MNKIVLHIPHSSERLPLGFFKNVKIEKNRVKEFCHVIADSKTRWLFGGNSYKKVVFNYSRIFCDVEKFVDDEKEIMSKFGMGAIYTKTNKGETFLTPTKAYKEKVLKKYYYPHHKKLDSVVQKMEKDGRVILVDCHSFSKDIIMFDNKKQDLPDICIGYNEEKPNEAANLAIEYFKNLGYKVKENYPYSGSMIPDYLLESPSENVLSLMIEINKELYLNKKEGYKALKLQINELFKHLETLN